MIESDCDRTEKVQKERIEQLQTVKNKRFEPVINNGMRSLYESYTVTRRLVRFVFRVLEQWMLFDKRVKIKRG